MLLSRFWPREVEDPLFARMIIPRRCRLNQGRLLYSVRSWKFDSRTQSDWYNTVWLKLCWEEIRRVTGGLQMDWPRVAFFLSGPLPTWLLDHLPHPNQTNRAWANVTQGGRDHHEIMQQKEKIGYQEETSAELKYAHATHQDTRETQSHHLGRGGFCANTGQDGRLI